MFRIEIVERERGNVKTSGRSGVAQRTIFTLGIAFGVCQ